VGLGLIAEVLGLPGKKFLDAEVYQHILAGEHQRVREYCKLDVLTTLLVFLRWCLHRGDLDRERAERLLEVVRAAVAAEEWEGWKGVGQGLVGALG
jgi:predicted PolB exonuclease-like 3'-5' exonuclease